MLFVTDYHEKNKNTKNGRGAAAKDDDDEGEEIDLPMDTPSTSESGSAPSPDDPVRQITQCSSRLAIDAKPGSNSNPDIVLGDAQDIVPMMDAETEHMLNSQSGFDVQHWPLVTAFGPMSSSQSHPALTVDTQNLYGLKAGQVVDPRKGRQVHSMRSNMGRFNRHQELQHQQDLMIMQGWANGPGGPGTSPADFLPLEYTFNGTQCHTPIPNQTFRMAEAAMSGMGDGTSPMDMALSATTATPATLLAGDHHHLSMHHPGHFGHPISATTACMTTAGMYHNPLGRPMPTRTMSTASHHQVTMMDHHHHQHMAAAAAEQQAMYFTN